jgi:predicted secreted Zn-dependent protease
MKLHAPLFRSFLKIALTPLWLAAMPFPAGALEKCVGPDGKISYVDRCPGGTRAPSKTDEQLVPPPRPAPKITHPELEPPPAAPAKDAAPAVPAAPPPAAQAAPAPPPAIVPAAPSDVQLAYYDVQGSDHASLMKALNSRAAGHAQSSWKLSYQYLPRREKGQCKVGSLTTKLELTMTLPRWSPPPEARQDLVDRWARYVNALMSFENTRLEHAREMERALKPALLGVPSAADCAALDKAVTARYEALREEVKARETRPDASQTLVFESDQP